MAALDMGTVFNLRSYTMDEATGWDRAKVYAIFNT